jgi:ATP-binding protein involved in chromosome partitioning
MSVPDRNAVLQVLADVKDPENGRSVTQLELIQELTITGEQLSLKLGLTTYSAPLWADVQNEVTTLLRQKFPSLKQIDVTIVPHARPAVPLGPFGLSIKSIIAVGSGKGGVGKSTIAASLAVGLARSGAKVGLMDADVYGPSVPHLFGMQGQPDQANGRLEPIIAGDIKLMSIGFLVAPDKAVAWRGPMLHKAIQQFLGGVNWGELDYLIIDMPPGTGDIALSLSQTVPLTGAVVVCTPQDVALIDAIKAITMFRQVNIPILGIVENMSYFICPDNGKRYDIFGHGGAQREAIRQQIPFLGEVPINIQLRVNGDEGQTGQNFDVVDSAPYLQQVCYRLVKTLSEQHKAKPALPTLSIL